MTATAAPAPSGDEGLNLSALTVEQMADILGKASGTTIDAALIRADVESGAPADENGRMNLLAYAAWLAKNTEEA
jgi:hypothetical protein